MVLNHWDQNNSLKSFEIFKAFNNSNRAKLRIDQSKSIHLNTANESIQLAKIDKNDVDWNHHEHDESIQLTKNVHLDWKTSMYSLYIPYKVKIIKINTDMVPNSIRLISIDFPKWIISNQT